MRLEDKLSILADAAKYDVSCASSGSRRKHGGNGVGNAAPGGICHTFTADGRCVSLLKILYTNACIYDCAYCANRSGNDVPRAAFTPREIVELTMDFYRRNYIEGLFLSSGVVASPDDTMERLVRTVEGLRSGGFHGYIHLKCVPFASPRLIHRAGLAADRLSVNIELPSEASLKRLTREKTYDAVLGPMGAIHEKIAETREDQRRLRHTPIFSPAGQSTQLIVGASPESDYDILSLADRLYREKELRRVYFSAFLPGAHSQQRLPGIDEPPLTREHRLYQADWLMRLYGFSIQEVIDRRSPFLDLNTDPKQAFARRHPERFPVDLNTAEREMILKVPGIGLTSAERILRLRKKARIRQDHLRKMGVVVSRALPYLVCDGTPAVQWRGASPPSERNGGLPSGTAGTPESSPARAAQSVFVFDGTFEGLLTAVFAAYARKQPPDAVEACGAGQMALFDRRVAIATDSEKADRVWKGLTARMGAERRRQLHDAFLSGDPGAATAICRVIMDAVPGPWHPKPGAHLPSHLLVEKLAFSVRREAHRMKGFVRFQHEGRGRYVAMIAPRYDVLPLIRTHFESRFSDQAWIIFDTARNYGLFFNDGRTREISDLGRGQKAPVESADEQLCQALWRRYYEAASIARRQNPRLHLRKLPRRYWRYLTEKAT